MASETVTWIDPASTSHLLDGSTTANPLATDGRQGMFDMPVAQLDQRTPLQPGTTVRFTDFLPRQIVLPLLVSGNGNETTLRTQIRAMTSVWFPPSTPGILRATDTAGLSRDLNCYYTGGLEGDESLGNRRPGSITIPLQLEAADPFWYDTSLTSTTYTGPFTTAQTPTITYTGDFATYPIITIHGPGVSPVISDTYPSGLVPFYSLNNNGGITLGVSDVLVIDARPGHKTVILNSVTNEAQILNLNNTFFALVPGANLLSIQIASSTGATTVQFQYKQAYFSC